MTELKEKEVELKSKNKGKNWDLKHDGKTGDHNGPKDPDTAYPVIKLDKNDGPHLITFEIKTSATNVTFSKDAIWVKEGSKPQAGDMHDQIAWRVDPEGKKLYVVDWNDNSAKPPHAAIDLHYQLNFNNHDPVDPIINNGGTTKPFVVPPNVPQPPTTPIKTTEASGANAPEGYAGQIAGLDVAALVLGLIVGLIVGFLLFRR